MVLSNDRKSGRKEGDHLALVRIQAIILHKQSEITKQPNKAIDRREKVGPEALSQFTPPVPLLPVLPLVSPPHDSRS